MDKREEAFQQMIKKASTTKEKLFLSGTWLFSTKGYERVGIRELCRCVNIKESSFYNHYVSKEALLNEIFNFYINSSEKTALTEAEIHAVDEIGDVDDFFRYMMKKFSSVTDNLIFSTIRQIVVMESFTNPKAAKISQRNLYFIRRNFLEKALVRMQEKGFIYPCDVRRVTAEYCYGLMGLLDEYLLLELWNEDTSEISQKIVDHVIFFADMLKKENGRI